MLHELLRDVRFATRALVLKDRAFSLTALTTLALGIGATTAITSVINAVLLTPLPYPEPDRLVRLYQASRGAPEARQFVTGPDFFDYRDAGIFESLATAYTYRETGFDLTGGDRPERVAGLEISAEYFHVLGLPPALGREFERAEERADARLAVVSHGLWQRWFDGAPDAIGRTLTLDGAAYTVVGVAPAGFRDPMGRNVDVWTPEDLTTPDNNGRGNHYLSLVGRLRPEGTLREASAALEVLSANLEAEYPDSNTGRLARIERLLEDRVGDARPLLGVLLGAVGLVLLIACVNVANLLLARGAAREKELAIRAALGSGRWRLTRQLLTESLVIAIAGGLAGLGLAYGGVRALVALGPEALPRVDQIGVDPRVLLVSAALVLMTPLLFGLAPALHGSSPDLERSLRDGGRAGGGGVRAQRTRRTLIVVQIALAFILMVGAGLLARSFVGILDQEIGFRSAGVLTFRINLPDARYDDPGDRMTFYRRFSERLEAVPGIVAAGAVSRLPATGEYHSWSFLIEGRPRPERGQPWPLANIRCVDGGYFDALGIGLTSGRLLDRRDTLEAPPVVLVNQALARTYFADEDPLGQRVNVGDAIRTIVGIVDDVRQDLRDPAVPKAYLAHDQFGGDRNWSMVQVVRAAAGRTDIASVARRELAAIDPDLIVHDVRPLDDVVAANIAGPRFAMTLMGTFAGLALLLAAVGLYGVVAFAVAGRTREIGIRMALGAHATDVLRLVLGQGLGLAAAGIALGLVGAAVGARLMTSLLYQIEATDAATFAAALALVGAVALGATLMPARRAVAVEPTEALRAE